MTSYFSPFYGWFFSWSHLGPLIWLHLADSLAGPTAHKGPPHRALCCGRAPPCSSTCLPRDVSSSSLLHMASLSPGCQSGLVYIWLPKEERQKLLDFKNLGLYPAQCCFCHIPFVKASYRARPDRLHLWEGEVVKDAWPPLVPLAISLLPHTSPT